MSNITKENYKADELLRDANHLLETCFWACMNETATASESVGHTISEAQNKIKAARKLIDPRNTDPQEGEAA
jgi:hypothetical protein